MNINFFNIKSLIDVYHYSFLYVFLQIAILEYLEETYPEKALLPKDVLGRLKVREICEIIGSGIQPLQNLSVLQKLGQDKQKEWAVYWMNKGFTGRVKELCLQFIYF